MSERGSFVSQYIYCAKCLEAVKPLLLRREKYLCSCQVPSWEGGLLPIIAGKIGGIYEGEEADTIESMRDELEKVICHPLTIVVLADNGRYRVFLYETKH